MPFSLHLFLITLFLLIPSHPSHAAASDAQILHLINRISFGATPGQIDTVRRMGLEGFIEQQLTPRSIPPTPALTQALNEFPLLTMSREDLAEHYAPPRGQNRQGLSPEEKKGAAEKERLVVNTLAKAKLIRAVLSEAQLQEVMTDFWFNHFNVYAKKGPVAYTIVSYEQEAIRPYALGHFSELLMATARHPAMMFYLDNHLNTSPQSAGANTGKKNGLNENYARELMELHTLGVKGGYTQTDVTTLAEILTGWGGIRPALGVQGFTQFNFDEKRHDHRSKTLLGNTIKGGGEEAVSATLLMLARMPATAHHIAYKLAEYFVDDHPPETLVTAMASTFLKTDGDIAAVLRTLFYSEEFWSPNTHQKKFKSPFHYIVSTLRAAQVLPTDQQLNHILGQSTQMGERLYFCVTPNGYANTNDAWLSSDALLKRIDFATMLGRIASPHVTENIYASRGNAWSDSTRQTIPMGSTREASTLLLSSPEFVYY